MTFLIVFGIICLISIILSILDDDEADFYLKNIDPGEDYDYD